ncbi:MAG: hypothetical protein ACM3VT_20315 [Solirubrobacterales bacterium]
MRTRFVKPALAAVVLIAALAVGVETLRPDKAAKINAYSAEIQANTALDLDPKAAIPLRQAQPEDFDVTWDSEAGGTLRIMPGSALRLLPIPWKEAEWDEVVPWAISSLGKIQESDATSVSARQSPYAAVLTSEGNLAIVRIRSYDQSRASLVWRVESTSLWVFASVQTIALACVDPGNAATQPCAIDFDTGRAVTIPAETLALASEDFLNWLQQNGVDAIARISEDGAGLAGVELAFQKLEPGLWAQPSAMELRGLMSLGSTPHQSRDPILFEEGQYQYVYPFRTREGGIGILQMLGANQAARTVEFRYRMTQENAPGQAQAEVQEDPESAQLLRSADWFNRLGRSVLIYASKHDDWMPQSLEEIKEFADSEEQYQWYLANVEYLGAGHSVSNPPTVLIAYDKTLLATGKGTIALFLDTHIAFIEPRDFAKYGLAGGIEAVKQKNGELFELGASEDGLNGLGRALRFYASENEDRLPASLEDVKKHFTREERYQWITQNVQYLGAGLLSSQSPSLVVAYDKTLLAKGAGTNALFLDNHVEFIPPEKLAEHGLPSGK